MTSLHKLTLAGVLLAAAAVPPATAAEGSSLPAGIGLARQILVGLKRGSLDRAQAARASGRALPLVATQATAGNLVGTWYVVVPGERPEDTFFAYQTFGSEGTIVETSSLLGSLTEGPAQGAWRQGTGTQTFTFELFAFDGGAPVGRIRVRGTIAVDGDSFEAQSLVDVLDLDGTVVAAEVGGGPFTGSRVRPQGL